MVAYWARSFTAPAGHASVRRQWPAMPARKDAWRYAVLAPREAVIFSPPVGSQWSKVIH